MLSLQPQGERLCKLAGRIHPAHEHIRHGRPQGLSAEVAHEKSVDTPAEWKGDRCSCKDERDHMTAGIKQSLNQSHLPLRQVHVPSVEAFRLV